MTKIKAFVLSFLVGIAISCDNDSTSNTKPPADQPTLTSPITGVDGRSEKRRVREIEGLWGASVLDSRCQVTYELSVADDSDSGKYKIQIFCNTREEGTLHSQIMSGRYTVTYSNPYLITVYFEQQSTSCPSEIQIAYRSAEFIVTDQGITIDTRPLAKIDRAGLGKAVKQSKIKIGCFSDGNIAQFVANAEEEN